MQILIIIGIAVIYNLLWGTLLYAIGTSLIPEKQRSKFYEIVPLYPKRKYSVMLYGIASILYTFLSIEIGGNVFVSLLCVIISSQIVRGIAKFRKEELEESMKEEIERKRKSLD